MSISFRRESTYYWLTSSLQIIFIALNSPVALCWIFLTSPYEPLPKVSKTRYLDLIFPFCSCTKTLLSIFNLKVGLMSSFPCCVTNLRFRAGLFFPTLVWAPLSTACVCCVFTLLPIWISLWGNSSDFSSSSKTCYSLSSLFTSL